LDSVLHTGLPPETHPLFGEPSPMMILEALTHHIVAVVVVMVLIVIVLTENLTVLAVTGTV